jgi:hypothetical protein
MVGLELKCYVKSAYLNFSQSTSYTAKFDFQNVEIIENSVEICDFVLTEKS